MRKNITYGLLTSAGLIMYFLFMKLIGQESNFGLRFLNFFIVVGGTYLLFRSKFLKPGNDMSYFSGLSSGIVMNLVAVVGFLIFMAAYVTFLDPQFMEVLENSKIWGKNLSLTAASFAIFMEGTASGLVISFTWMQYFQKYLQGKTAASASAR